MNPTSVKQSKGSNERPKAAGQKLMLNGSFWPGAGVAVDNSGGAFRTFNLKTE
ncbi:MAG: hypothetical protein P4L96_18545 [Rhodoferax sp.]|nr:hypothetical protein [Rhodoferax sp.]